LRSKKKSCFYFVPKSSAAEAMETFLWLRPSICAKGAFIALFSLYSPPRSMSLITNRKVEWETLLLHLHTARTASVFVASEFTNSKMFVFVCL
jgi:hypothetical protein